METITIRSISAIRDQDAIKKAIELFNKDQFVELVNAIDNYGPGFFIDLWKFLDVQVYSDIRNKYWYYINISLQYNYAITR